MLNIEEDYELILNNIEGLIIIDTDEKNLFMTDKLAKKAGFENGKATVGKQIRDIFPPGVNNLYKVIYSGKKQIGYFNYFEGRDIVSNSFPIYKKGELVGAIDYDLFESSFFLKRFLDKVYEVSQEVNYYKGEFVRDNNLHYSIDNIIGKSQSIEKLKEKIRNVANTNSPILIQGETGSGKELVARAIYELSTKNMQKFSPINCAAIPEALFESELYGYEEGSFTDARRGGKKGIIELANGGTLFLDEIDQLPMNQQPKLLRFLQEKEITRIGGERNIPVDIRIISASNQNLTKLMYKGKFREDLYYRLNVVEINVPPLRERKEDIPLLVEYLLEEVNNNLCRTIHRIESVEEDALKMLCDYNWPGNVRELQNVLERAANDCYAKVLELEYFEDFLMKKAIYDTTINSKRSVDLEKVRENAEREAIVKMLDYYNGNKSKIAKLLKISRETLYQKIEKYNI